MRKTTSIKSRKQQRKEKRIAKKIKKHEFFTKRKDKQKSESTKLVNQDKIIPKQPYGQGKLRKITPKNIGLSLQEERLREIKNSEQEAKRMKRDMQKVRKQQMEQGARADDIEIKKLEKQLGLSRKKESAKNNLFSSDGLDYLLDVCEGKNLKENEGADSRFRDDDSDFDDDFAVITGKPKKRKKEDDDKGSEFKLKKRKEVFVPDSDSEPEEFLSTKAGSKSLAVKKDVDTKNKELSDSDVSEEEGSDQESGDDELRLESEEDMSENIDDDDDDGFSKADDNIENEEAMENDVENNEESEREPDSKNKSGTWEDIYGRTRDKEGNVVTKYQPPHLRQQTQSDSGKIGRLKKNLKGLLNRLADSNIVSIASQVEQLYNRNSRNDMNETMWSLYSEALLGESSTPLRLVAEHALLVAVLSANVGSEVGAHCLQRCATHWHQHFSSGGNAAPPVHDKRTNNALTLLCYLYHFKLFHCTLLYDILDLLVECVNEKTIELILDVLRTVGFSLRKDDPGRLKEFVLKTQSAANKSDSNRSEHGTRIAFLLETVMAIKNNNMSKIPNYNPDYNEGLKKTLRVSVRKGNYSAELKISLDDILKVDERGRWWVVGSAWTGEKPPEERDLKPIKNADEAFSDQLRALAKKQRMNTENRRTVFCIIMSAEDYMDAFEKLVKLGLKGPLERDIVNVLLHCLLMEKKYNPYYEHLARRFCSCNRKYQVMLQFAVWDRIKELKALSSIQISHMAKFLGNLILEKNLALSILKVVELSELDKHGVRLMRQLLLTILLCDSEETMLSAFARVATSKALKLFREGLRLFLHHFVLRKSKDIEGTDMALLTVRVKLADSALSAMDRI